MKSAKENLSQQQGSEVENIHAFSLKPLDSKAFMSQVVVVDFSPQISESKSISLTPRLNRSKDCFQSLFQSPYIKNLLQIHGQIPQTLLSIKQGPSRTPISQKSSVDKAEGSKPRPTSKFCQLCKQRFSEDYLYHIKHTVHVNNLKNNPFQKYIQSLVQDFKKNLKRERPASLTSRDEGTSSKPKKKLKEDCISTNQILPVGFPYKAVNSTESTNNSFALPDPTQKKQTLRTLKE